MSSTLALGELDSSDLAAAGGKAASLARLAAGGFRVPPGFCLLAPAFRAATGMKVDLTLRQEIVAALSSLRKKATEAGFGSDPRFAVRSSAVAEDLPDASFAGIYRTVLGVRTDQEVVDAIEACWASATSPEATRYMEERLGVAGSDMAVIVQALVPADVAGVLFTAHPVTGALDQAIVNSSYGLGEAVVSSLVDADTFTISRASGSVVEQRIGSKERMIAVDGATVEVPAKEREQSSLESSQLRQLAEVANRIERQLQFPQDVEWAFAGGVLYLLQARRITTLQEVYYTAELHRWSRKRGLVADPETVWLRGTPLSSLPVSPLYFSEMSQFFTDMFGALVRLEGGTPGTRQDFRYFRGWSYMNTLFGSDRRRAPDRVWDRAWMGRIRLQLRHPRSLAFWSTAKRYYYLRDHVWLPSIATRRPDYATAQATEIQAFIEFIEVQRRERSILAATGVDHAGMLLMLMGRLLRAWANEREADSLPELTSGLPGLQTYDENLGVWELGRVALRSPEVAAAVTQGDYAALDGLPEGRALNAAVDAFRTEHPHRGASDRDLQGPRWGDSREMLLDQVRIFVRSPESRSPAEAHARAAARRQTVTREVERRIRRGPFGWLRVWLFRALLTQTQVYWVYRDNQRHSFDHYFYNLRCAYRALGVRLAERGALANPDDIFFLSKDEVYATIDGQLALPEASYRATWRKNWWTVRSTEEPPAYLQGDSEFVPEGARETPPGEGLRGVGGSAGRATALARVIRDVRGLSELMPGEILVTHAIDPAWTPVFSMVRGVVTEEGGMLSHATVIAREYGIPAVIGLAGATRSIKTGDTVTIDGLRGLVVIEGKEGTTVGD
ncbi:MAG: PEP/pyruvate-binding domain-containing protein [Dehalococcoidia bacterium]